MRISDWSSDVCSSDLTADEREGAAEAAAEVLEGRQQGRLNPHRVGTVGDRQQRAVDVEKKRIVIRRDLCQRTGGKRTGGGAIMRPGGRLGATIDAREFGFAVGVRGHWSLCPACNEWGSGAVTEPFLCPVPFFQVLAGPSERTRSEERRVGKECVRTG